MVKSQHLLAIIFVTKDTDYSFGPNLQQYVPEKKLKRKMKHLMICVFFPSVPFTLKSQQVKIHTSKIFAFFYCLECKIKTKQEEENIFHYTPTFYLCTLSKEMLRDQWCCSHGLTSMSNQQQIYEYYWQVWLKADLTGAAIWLCIQRENGKAHCSLDKCYNNSVLLKSY